MRQVEYRYALRRKIFSAVRLFGVIVLLFALMGCSLSNPQVLDGVPRAPPDTDIPAPPHTGIFTGEYGSMEFWGSGYGLCDEMVMIHFTGAMRCAA
ncbi:hypothetical protein FACS1894171_1190 [Clostridia bacterium]|nr:hypothetical protein FACS1894171_1190 [Clostridia bacterium]